MPMAVPGSPAPRSPALDLLVEQVARVVARARAQQGDAAVRARVDAAITPADAATAARVLRVLGQELGEAPVDLGVLDARLQALATGAAQSPTDDATPDASADAGDARIDDAQPGRPHPPTGLRSSMRGRRR